MSTVFSENEYFCVMLSYFVDRTTTAMNSSDDSASARHRFLVVRGGSHSPPDVTTFCCPFAKWTT